MMNVRIAADGNMIAVLGSMLVGVSLLSACETKTSAMTPQAIEQQYGVSGAYQDNVATPNGPIKGTVVPVTLADGRKAQLVIPERQRNDEHAVYLLDGEGLHPVRMKENVSRADVTTAPAIVEKRREPQHENKRSWEKDALIIGGGAAAGTAIGAVAGGKKGAAVGATAGGIGGLIYDLATRDKK